MVESASSARSTRVGAPLIITLGKKSPASEPINWAALLADVHFNSCSQRLVYDISQAGVASGFDLMQKFLSVQNY